MMVRQLLTFFTTPLIAIAFPLFASAQPLLDDNWWQVRSTHFVVFSQLSNNQTERFIQELETWRRAASYLIAKVASLPVAAVENHVYLFDEPGDLQNFSQAEEKAFFYPAPRQNFMAVVYGDEDSLAAARHHYVHFLMRNFTDLRIPRWYEEGLAGYLANISVENGQVKRRPYTREEFEGSLIGSQEVSLEELIFDESALASPRLVQRANLKSEVLLYFLLHGHEETGFVDRRNQLDRFLALSLEGRSQRYAYDQAFDLPVAQLDQEYERYLSSSSLPEAQLGVPGMDGSNSNVPLQLARIEQIALANALGELAINSGNFELGRDYFQAAIDRQSNVPRSYSGLADALRMQEPVAATDANLVALYQQAISLGPDNPFILLDYGEYLEALLTDCDTGLRQDQIDKALQEINLYFSKAIELAPNTPEANLAMGQYYLLRGLDYRSGIPYQTRALALLPADTFIMEQTIKYLIASAEFGEAERLIDELAQPLHYWQEFEWITNLRRQLQHKKQNMEFDQCEHGV